MEKGDLFSSVSLPVSFTTSPKIATQEAKAPSHLSPWLAETKTERKPALLRVHGVSGLSAAVLNGDPGIAVGALRNIPDTGGSRGQECPQKLTCLW